MQVHLSDEEMRVVMAALEGYISKEQENASEQGLEVTADQETAEALLEQLEKSLPTMWGA
jgi:hypothetical protein